MFDSVLNTPLLMFVGGNLIGNGVKVIMFLSWIRVIYCFAVHPGHSPATGANFSTNNSILSAYAVFPCAVCFKTMCNYFQQLWWYCLFGHFDRNYSSFCQLPTPLEGIQHILPYPLLYLIIYPKHMLIYSV